jgi:hypothetical protein
MSDSKDSEKEEEKEEMEDEVEDEVESKLVEKKLSRIEEPVDSPVEKKPSRIVTTNRSNSEVDVVASLADLLHDDSSPTGPKKTRQIVLQNLSDKSSNDINISTLNQEQSLPQPSSLLERSKRDNSEIEKRVKKDLKNHFKKFIKDEIAKLKEQLEKLERRNKTFSEDRTRDSKQHTSQDAGYYVQDHKEIYSGTPFMKATFMDVTRSDN